MKLKMTKKVTLATTLSMVMTTAVVNATTASSEAVAKSLGDWVSIIAEILSVLCLIIFAIYMGRFITVKTDNDPENDEKIIPGVRNAMMTSLVGIAICQAAMIVAKLCF